MNKSMSVNKYDRLILRELATKVSEIAALPVMNKRRSLWERHNRLKKIRPLVFISPERSWSELIPECGLACKESFSRSIEMELRKRIYRYEHFMDDVPVENKWTVYKKINGLLRGTMIPENWGISMKMTQSSEELGAYSIDSVIQDASDLKRICIPEIEYDENTSLSEYNFYQDLFGDILDVILKGICHIPFNLMYDYISLRGLENMMYDLYDNPGMIHDAMHIFVENYLGITQICTNEKLFSLNNDETYHSSGGFGYSTELPQKDYNPDCIRPADLWASAQSQEMASVSPEMHEEFCMQYERKLLSHFGLNGYGCCDPLTYKLKYVFKIENVRRISVSPWADIRVCAEKLQDKYIFSWKPNPSHIADFNTEMVTEYISNTLDLTRDNIVEIILKDTHTCNNHPENFDEWTKITRYLIDERY